MSWIVSVILVVVLLAAFGMLMLCLLAALPGRGSGSDTERLRRTGTETQGPGGTEEAEMSWVGWAIIALFALIAALMGYMAWIIYYDDQRRGRK